MKWRNEVDRYMKKCHRCHRNNWHEYKQCVWCDKKLYTDFDIKLNWFMAGFSIVVIIAIAYQVFK